MSNEKFITDTRLQELLSYPTYTAYGSHSMDEDLKQALRELWNLRQSPVMWMGCTFEGDPPAGFASWYEWTAQNRVYAGVTIRVTKT